MRPFYITPVFALAISVAAVVAAQDNDKARKFLHDALQADNSEVMLGKLAADQAGDPSVKRYGQMLVDDHSMHRDQVLKVGAGVHLPDDSQPTEAALKERDKLKRLHGADFDKAFAKYIAKDHRQDIGEYEKGVKIGGDVGQMARDTLPTLHKHLREAEKLGG